MGWKFWHKIIGAKDGASQGARLPGIKGLPSHIGMKLVVKEKLDPDWVWELKMVKRPTAEDKNTYDFRVFSANQAADAGVQVVDYDSLAAHPDVILYFGSSNKTGSVFTIEQGDTVKAA